VFALSGRCRESGKSIAATHHDCIEFDFRKKNGEANQEITAVTIIDATMMGHLKRPRKFDPVGSRVPSIQGALHEEVEIFRGTDRPDFERG
jgi:hypothetical protein